MKTLRTILAGFAITAAALSSAGAQDLNQFLAELNNANRTQSQADRDRLAAFESAENDQRRLLAEAREELESLRVLGEELELQKTANDALIEELGEELEAKQGEFADVFTQSRQAARELNGVVEASLVSAQYPGRGETLVEISDADTLKSRAELDQIWITYFDEMIRQRDVVTFDAVVNNFNGDGTDVTVPVTRVGTFAAVASDRGSPRFLIYKAKREGGYGFEALTRNPPNSSFVDGAKALLRADAGDGVVHGIFDPSSGPLLSTVVETSTLEDRIEDGGIVGAIILFVLLPAGLLFGAFRLVQLVLVKAAVDAQARKSAPSRSNPLGRIMLAAEDASNSDVQTFEFQLDNAIIRESSGIDFGLNMLKLLAAVAPLLGLLGTVTGMIQTFEVIKLFGAGDPQQMAGGISQALVTTVLGLVAAIPLLFIHSFCASAARAVQQVLEEQAVGLVAEQAMKKGRG